MILVTGATGLLGSRLLYDLVVAGHKVRAIRRSESRMICIEHYFKTQSKELDMIEWVEADMLDIHSIDSALQNVDYVYHCAGKVSFQPADRDMIHQANVQGTANMVNLCLDKGIKKMCHVSSVAALGKTGTDEVITEENIWKKSKYNSYYSQSKYGAELEVWRGMAEGLNAAIVNPGLIVGPGNWKTDSSMIFGQVWKGLSFYTDGVNGLIDVKDVSNIMIRLMNSDQSGERFVLVAENLPLKKVMERIADGLKKKHPTIHAGEVLTGFAWRMEFLKSMFTGAKPVITKETALSAQGKNYYSSEKIRKLFNFQFTDVMSSIDQTSLKFMESMRSR